MVYYLKEGQSKCFRYVKLNNNRCEISPLNSNIKRTEKIVKKIKKKQIHEVVLSGKIKKKRSIYQYAKKL